MTMKSNSMRRQWDPASWVGLRSRRVSALRSPRRIDAALSTRTLAEPSLAHRSGRTLLLVWLVSSQVVVSAAESPCVPLPEGVVAFWQLDGDASDSAGDNHGSVGAFNYSFVSGYVGQAFSVPVISEGVYFGTRPALNVGASSGFTFEAWINPGDVANPYPIAEWSTFDGSLNYGPHLWINENRIPGTGGAGCLFVNIPDTARRDLYFASPPGLVKAGVWQHVALTYDKGNGVARIFLNGTQVEGRALGTYTPRTSGLPFQLGYRSSYGPYQGLLDEAALYDRALSPDEIKAIYDAGAAGKCPPITFTAFDFWSRRNPSGIQSPINHATFGNSTFVAVGGVGNIYTSGDGRTWLPQESGSRHGLSGAAFGGGRFVVVGEHGTILSSRDGTNWQPQTSGTIQPLRSVAYGGGAFVVVGDAGTILISTNATNWVTAPAVVRRPLNAVTFGKGTFATVGADGTILYSLDGARWTKADSGTTNWLQDVAFGGGYFVAVGFHDTVLASPDGRAWTRSATGTGELNYGVTYGNGMFLLVGSPGRILTSPDGANWQPRASQSHMELYTAVYGDGLFVVFGGSRNGAILASPDASTWMFHGGSGTTKTLRDLIFDRATFMAVGDGGTILTSGDGRVWTEEASGTTRNLRGVTSGNSSFVAVGTRGTILTSADGKSWTHRTAMHFDRPDLPPSQDDFAAVTFGGGKFVAISPGKVAVSTDAAEWNVHFVLEPNQQPFILQSIAYTNNQFRAVGPPGRWISTDGLNWQFDTQPSGGVWNRVIAVNGSFYELKSAPVASLHVEALNGVAYGANRYVIVGAPQAGYNSPIITSIDGRVEPPAQLRNSRTTRTLYAAAYGNGTFVAVGEGGTILQSDPLQ